MGQKRWTDEDIEYLREHIDKTSIKKIAKALNRTECAVVAKVYDIGISHKLNRDDKCIKKMDKQLSAYNRQKYHRYREQGLCPVCGKRWAEAGGAKCRVCKERIQQNYRNDNTRKRLYEYNKRRRAERKANNQCVNCGKPLEPQEIGVNINCARCRAKNMERTNIARMKMRIHGIKRKD